MRKITLWVLLFALALSALPHSAAQEPDLFQPVRSMELEYATGFQVDYDDAGRKLITLLDGSQFLVLPPDGRVPANLPAGAAVLRQPISNIYLAATSAMCLFDALDRLDAISLSGSRAESWYIENARLAMEEGRIRYAGKYSEPDYELLLGSRCSLAVESMMIGHASDVKRKLEELGIPVLTDQSSMEEHPLGRTEWMKLYAALLNEEEKAERLFKEQAAFLEETVQEEIPPKTVAFFYISSSGRVVARKSGDYVSKMIELAGGKYVFDNLGDPESSSSTATIEMETFYAAAKDADYIIYNSAIAGEVESLAQLLALNPLLKDFKAVKNGNVWCTSQNMFQETLQLGQMIREFHLMFSDSPGELDYLFPLT